MVTIVDTTASDVGCAENGSLHPGQTQSTAEVPAVNGPIENGLKITRKTESEGLRTG
jgi:hypothetical protein